MHPTMNRRSVLDPTVGLKQFTGCLDIEDRISVCIPTARVGIVTIFSLRGGQRIIGKSSCGFR